MAWILLNRLNSRGIGNGQNSDSNKVATGKTKLDFHGGKGYGGEEKFIAH